MPINLIIEEDSDDEVEIVSPIATEMEQIIPDDVMVINIKYNIPPEKDGTYDFNKIYDYFMIEEINMYVTEYTTILFTSLGIHVEGKAQKPHLHYNLIVEKFNIKSMNSNKSQHRKRWCDRNGFSNDKIFKDVSFVLHEKIDCNNPKYYTLSYPLKENISLWDNDPSYYLFNKKPMTEKQLNFLKSVGSEIYNLQVGMHLRREKCEERKKQSLTDLFDLCVKNKIEFNNYREMLNWLDVNYISTLELHDYPDPKNYKTNCQKIAVKLGFMRYSELC